MGDMIARGLASKAVLRNSKYDKLSFPMTKVPFNMQFNSIEKHYFEPLFYVPHTENMQSITYRDGYVYVGFDAGSGNGIVRKYDTGGKLYKETGLLPLGHTAGMVYRKLNSHIYVANGGGSSPTFLYEIDMEAATPSVISTLDFSSLGNSALIAIDNERDILYIHTSPGDTGAPTFYTCKFDGTVLAQFSIPFQGIPQGLEFYQDQLYFYTDNKITVMTTSGSIMSTISVPKSGESEGICIAGDYATTYFIIGYNAPNRLYALRSTDNQAQFHSYHPLTSVNRYDTGQTALLPFILTMAINTNAGTGNWQAATWAGGFNWQRIIKSITTTTGTTGTISIKLNQTIKSIGTFLCDVNFKMSSLGYVARCDFTEPDTLVIQVYSSTGTQIDPSTIVASCTIKCLIIGGTHIND